MKTTPVNKSRIPTEIEQQIMHELNINDIVEYDKISDKEIQIRLLYKHIEEPISNKQELLDKYKPLGISISGKLAILSEPIEVKYLSYYQRDCHLLNLSANINASGELEWHL